MINPPKLGKKELNEAGRQCLQVVAVFISCLLSLSYPDKTENVTKTCHPGVGNTHEGEAG